MASHEIGEHARQPYFSMDYVEGQNLAERSRNNPLPPQLAADYLKTIAEAGSTNRVVPQAGALVAFAGATATAVTITDGGLLRVWNLIDASVQFVVPGITRRKLEFGWGNPVALSPDGKLLALIQPDPDPARPDREIRLWDLPTGTERPSLPLGRQARCLEFSPDGALLALGDGDGNVLLWTLASGETQSLDRAHSYPVLALAFSPDGQTLATGSSDADSIRLWDLPTASPRSRRFAGQVGDVWSLAFLPDGRRLASGTRDGPIRIWNLDDPELAEVIPDRLHAHDYGNFVFSPDSKRIAGGCVDNTVRIWELATLQVTAVLSNAIYVAKFSADGRSLLVASRDGTPRWWDVPSGATHPVRRYGGAILDVRSVAFSPDGRIAALGLPDGQIQQQDIEAGRLVGAPLSGHTGAVRSVAFSLRGDRVISGGSDKTVRLWDRKTGQALWISDAHRGAVCAVAASPDGNGLASACAAETIKLWTLPELSTEPRMSISLHKSVVRTLAFSPDGKTLASGSEDDTVRLWNVALGLELASFPLQADVRLVAFAPDGCTLAAVTDTGTLRVFRSVSLEEADERFRAPIE